MLHTVQRTSSSARKLADAPRRAGVQNFSDPRGEGVQPEGSAREYGRAVEVVEKRVGAGVRTTDPETARSGGDWAAATRRPFRAPLHVEFNRLRALFAVHFVNILIQHGTWAACVGCAVGWWWGCSDTWTRPCSAQSGALWRSRLHCGRRAQSKTTRGRAVSYFFSHRAVRTLPAHRAPATERA